MFTSHGAIGPFEKKLKGTISPANSSMYSLSIRIPLQSTPRTAYDSNRSHDDRRQERLQAVIYGTTVQWNAARISHR